MSQKSSIVLSVITVVAMIALFVWGYPFKPNSAKQQENNLSELDVLRREILAIYQLSLDECQRFREGDLACIKTQFSANYHWYVLKDIDPRNGHPGTPGPLVK